MFNIIYQYLTWQVYEQMRIKHVAIIFLTELSLH